MRGWAILWSANGTALLRCAPDGAVHGGDAVGLCLVRRSFFHAEREGGGRMLIVQKAAFGAVRAALRRFVRICASAGRLAASVGKLRREAAEKAKCGQTCKKYFLIVLNLMEYNAVYCYRSQSMTGGDR